jgi:hypothetical protein
MVVLIGAFLTGVLVAAGLVYVLREDGSPVHKDSGKRALARPDRKVAKRADEDGLYAAAMTP